MTDQTPETATPQRSRLSKKWAIKIGLIATAVTGFGLAGLYDATVGYPKRGSNAAEFLEFQYLQQLGAAQMDFKASIADPKAALTELHNKDANTLAPAEQIERQWLEQLSYIHRLEPANASTLIPRTDFRGDKVGDAGQRREALRQRWTTSDGSVRSSSPLSPLDIFFQWVIVGICIPVGLYMFGLMMAAKAKVYRWDPAQQRLTLPGGDSLVPSDIEEFDKRKWHRLFITLKVKASHPQLGGKNVEIDLLRFEPVEDWVLAMERTAFPEHDEKPPEPAAAPEPSQA